jgi:hypothetical protein
MDPDRTLQEHGSGSFHDVHGAWVDSVTAFPPHQSPLNDFHGFAFNGLGMEPLYSTTPRIQPQRTTHQQLQPLMVPAWPSLLTSQSNYANGVMMSAAPVTMTPTVATPRSAPPATGRQSERPRKTLTDEDRRRMCKFAEKNPTVKQTEIGGKPCLSLIESVIKLTLAAMFGVERRYERRLLLELSFLTALSAPSPRF